MDPIESPEIIFWFQKRNRKQKPVANGNLPNGENVEEHESSRQAEETEKPKKPDKAKEPQVSFAEAAAKIGPSDLADFLVEVPDPYPPLAGFRLMRFLDYYGKAFSGVTCPWYDMFEPSRLSKLFDVIDVPLCHIPDPVYKTSVDWLNQHVPDRLLRAFVSWSFSYILKDVFKVLNDWPEDENPTRKSSAAIFVAVAMVLRSKPHLFTGILPHLGVNYKYERKLLAPLTIWMISQASKDNLSVGLYSWAHNLLPLVHSRDPLSRHLILCLVEKILAEPDARTILIDAPVWKGERLIPPPSFEILLRLTFPSSSARVKATSRFEAIYPLLKEVALAGAPESHETKEVTQQIFTVSLRLLAGEGIKNPVLAKEATEIAIGFLTKNVDCWEHWDNLYHKNIEASVALLKSLVEKWKDQSLKLSSSSRKAMKQVTRKFFICSLVLAGDAIRNPILAKEAIWSLTEIVDCCKRCRWDNLYKENLEASFALPNKRVDKWKVHYPKVSSFIPEGTPESKEMKEATQQILASSLKLAKEGNTFLAKEAASLALWSLIENVDCWKLWDNLYMENLEASVALLKKLVDEWEYYSVKLSLSSSPSDTLTLSQTMKSFMLKNKKAKKAITERGVNGSLYKEADKSCQVISRRLSGGSGSLNGSATVVLLLFAAVALLVYSNLDATTELQNLVDSLELHLYVSAITRCFKQ